MMRCDIWKAAAVAGLLALGGVLAARAGTGTVYRVGALANEGTGKCVRTWSPTIAHLNQAGLPWQYELAPLGFEEIAAAVRSKLVDFVICNSGLYVEFQMLNEASAIATSERGSGELAAGLFGGVVFTRADRADIARFADLKGRTFAAVDPKSFGGWVAARREFQHDGLDPEKDFRALRFTRNHDEVVAMVRDGRADAGVVRTLVLEDMAADGVIRLEDFKVLPSPHFHYAPEVFPFHLSTRLYPEWPCAVLPHVDRDTAMHTAIALLAMPPSAADKTAPRIRWLFPMNYQPVVDCLQELRVSPFEKLGDMSAADLLARFWKPIAGGVLLLAIMAGLLIATTRLNHQMRLVQRQLEKGLAEREATAQALRTSEERFRMVFQHAPLGLLYCDAQGIVRDFNERLLRLFNVSAEQLRGFNLLRQIRDEKMLGAIHQALAGELSFYEGDYTSVLSGKIVPIRMYMQRITDANGQILGGVGIIEDCTEAQRAEATIHANEARLRAVNAELERRAAELEHSRRHALSIMEDATQAKARAEELYREQKALNEKLRLAMEELEQFNQIMVGRELRMIELKAEINQLRAAAGLPPAYPLPEEEAKKTDEPNP